MAIASKLGQVHAGAVIWASNASPDVPSGCDGCGAPFSLDHALVCRKGAWLDHTAP